MSCVIFIDRVVKLVNIAYSISSLVILIMESDSKNDCYQVWGNLMMGFLISVLYAYRIRKLVAHVLYTGTIIDGSLSPTTPQTPSSESNDNSDQNLISTTNTFSLLLILAQFIWSMIIYIRIDDTCTSYYNTNYEKLWIMWNISQWYYTAIIGSIVSFVIYYKWLISKIDRDDDNYIGVV